MVNVSVAHGTHATAVQRSTGVRWTEVLLIGKIGPEEFDRNIAECLAGSEFLTGERVGLIMNFGRTEFVQLSVLHLVIALAKALTVQGHKIAFRIPESKKVRDIWARWGFASAFQDITGLSLWSIVPINERKFSTENNEYYSALEYPAGPGFSGTSIRSTNFFGFHTEFLRPGTVSPLMATQEVNNWTSQYIQDFLLGKIGLPTKAVNYLPGRVIFEAYMNAMRHPDATAVQISAFTTKSLTNRPTSFSVHFWDDGVSMVDTLLTAIRQERQVQAGHPSEFHRNYLLKYSYDDDSSASYETEIDTRDLKINKFTTPIEALAYTILPGVTSSPAGQNLAVAPDVAKEHDAFARPGMGLFVLVNAVVEVLGGSVAFRSGRYFMNVRKPRQPELRSYGKSQITIRIKERSEMLPEFRGNLVTARLSIKAAAG